MQRWFLFPTTDLLLLKERHDTAECLIRQENLPTAGEIFSVVKGIKNVPRLVDSLQAGNATVTTWKSLGAFAQQVLRVRELISELSGGAFTSIGHRTYSSVDSVELQAISQSIEGTIDWEQSTIERRVCVRAGVDEQLDEWRQAYAGLPSFLASVVKRLQSTYTFRDAGRINVVYFPQLGYLIAIRLDDEGQQSESIEVPENWSFHFATDISTYYKSPEMNDLDEHVGDLHSIVADREIDLMNELSIAIVKVGSKLVRLAELCAEFEW